MDPAELDPVELDAQAAERALMTALFSARGRTNPEAVTREADVPGCRYAFVRDALHDPRMAAPAMPTSSDLMFQVVGRFLSRLPPERHRRLRGHFSGLFTPRRVERYRAQVERTTVALLDSFPGSGPVDLVARLTRPLPFTVIAAALGVPGEDHGWLRGEMETFGAAVAGQRDHAEVELGNSATRRMLDYFDDLLRRRAAAPEDDLLTALAASVDRRAPEGADQYRDDVLANCLFFVLAGHATTTGLLSAGVETLLGHPDQLDRLRADPQGWPAAVEELLRYVSPTTVSAARALEDVEISGCAIPAGGQRALVFVAANRDPEVFQDPDVFDATRDPNPHLAFAAGLHHCVGAPLARMHAEIALPALFDRFPGLRLAGMPQWLGSVPVRQVASLPVDWA